MLIKIFIKIATGVERNSIVKLVDIRKQTLIKIMKLLIEKMKVDNLQLSNFGGSGEIVHVERNHDKL
jgi:hypothetical protein